MVMGSGPCNQGEWEPDHEWRARRDRTCPQWRRLGETAAFLEWLDARRAAQPIPGQPGLYRSGLRGLGATQAELTSKFQAAQSAYTSTKTSLAPLLNAYPQPVSTDGLKQLFAAVQNLTSGGSAGDVGAIVTAQQFVGVLRMGLAAAIRNITLAQGILTGPNLAGHEDIVASLLVSAQGVLDALGTMISTASVAQGAIAAGARRLGLSGLGAFGVDDATLVVIAAVGFVVGAVLIYALYSAVNASNTAWDAAGEACARDAAAGHPCTGTQWEAYRQGAQAAATRDGLIPDLSGFFRQITTGLVGIGALVAAAAVGYAVWTTLPAASAVRSRLEERARR